MLRDRLTGFGVIGIHFLHILLGPSIFGGRLVLAFITFVQPAKEELFFISAKQHDPGNATDLEEGYESVCICLGYIEVHVFEGELVFTKVFGFNCVAANGVVFESIASKLA